MSFVQDSAAQVSARDWVNSIAALGTPAANKILLSFVDSSLDVQPIHLRWEGHYERGHLAAHIARVAKADAAAMTRILEICGMTNLSDERREILADVIEKIGDADVLSRALILLSDQAARPIPRGISGAISNIVMERRPHEQSQGIFSLHPQNATLIRAKLLEMVLHDELRRHTAFHILGDIEDWRLRSGRPTDEPRHPNLNEGCPWPPLNAVGRSH